MGTSEHGGLSLTRHIKGHTICRGSLLGVVVLFCFVYCIHPTTKER